MKEIQHPEIDSQFFEFRKMKAFLETGVYLDVPGITHPPINVPQQYVHSQLFIDLISILDNAVNYFFKLQNLKEVKGKKPFDYLTEIKQIQSPQHFKWYKDLRNESAHEFARHEWHFLDQATEHIANQFEFWEIFSAKLNFAKYIEVASDGKSYVGSRVDNQVILAFETFQNPIPIGTSSSSRLHVDMSFNDFIKIEEVWSRRVIYSRAS